jgi:NADH dehydrogenase/NADH:ubiquinone oxidoreductase subunit G
MSLIEVTMIYLTIDDKPIELTEGRTLLEACREHSIHVPTLCHHPALEPYGGCRLCMVEIIQGSRPSRLVAACVYPCEDGLVVKTNSEMATRSRRITVELLMASAYNTPEIASLAENLGVKEIRFKMPEEDACILCGLCVRACKEIVNINAISVIQRGIAKKVSTPFQIASSLCIGCGTCVLICPTGVFKLSDVIGAHGDAFSDPSYRRRYYRVGTELDLHPNFAQDVPALLEGLKNGE